MNADPAQTLEYNTLSVPRKGHYKLTLPDGSKVWLNAESPIVFPTNFNGIERRVVVTGETYFEVVKDKTKPFRVVADDMTVEALGTQFNINAYPNESMLAATLAEGSLLVAKGKDENILKPGQQAQTSDNHFTIAEVDPTDITAWKNNEFKFHNTSLESIMRQVERWYDCEVYFKIKLMCT